MRSLIAAACLLLTPVAADAASWTARMDSPSCSSSLAKWIDFHGGKGQKILHVYYSDTETLMARVRWSSGVVHDVLIGKRGGGGETCVLAVREPLAPLA